MDPERLRLAREARGLTKYALAKALGRVPAWIDKLEAGGIKDPSYTNVRALADVLGVTPDYLMGVVEQSAKEDDTARLIALGRSVRELKVKDPEFFIAQMKLLPPKEQSIVEDFIDMMVLRLRHGRKFKGTLQPADRARVLGVVAEDTTEYVANEADEG